MQLVAAVAVKDVVWKFAKIGFLWNLVEDSDLEVTQDQADFSLFPLALVRWPYDLWRPSYKSSLAVFRFLEGFLQIADEKKSQNPDTLEEYFGFARVLHLFWSGKFKKMDRILTLWTNVLVLHGFFTLFSNFPLFTFAKTLHENQDKFVTWPSKVVRPPDQCQRVGGKISLIMSDLKATVLNQIPQKFNFRKFYILRPLLRLQQQQNHRTCL